MATETITRAAGAPKQPRLAFNIAYLLLAIPPLCWAGNHVVGRAVVDHVPPGSLSALRWLFAALMLLPFALPHVRRDWPALWAKRGVVVFLSLVGAGIFSTMQFVVARWSPALNMSVLNSVAPVMILIASRILFGDKLRGLQLLGVTISFGGLMAIATQGELTRLQSLSFEKGDLAVIANMSLWAIYCACLRLRPNVHWMSFTFVLIVISFAVNVPYALWEHASGQPLLATRLTVVAVLYSAACTSVLAYACWNKGVELIGAPRASAFLHLIPLYGAVLATLILGESLHGFHVAGFLLILSGVWLAARPQKAA
jgi:drug/metabolite transporter (DMT)-like permease